MSAENFMWQACVLRVRERWLHRGSGTPIVLAPTLANREDLVNVITHMPLDRINEWLALGERMIRESKLPA